MKPIEFKQDQVPTGIPATLQTLTGRTFTGIICGIKQGKIWVQDLVGVKETEAFLLTLTGRVLVEVSPVGI